MNNKLRKKQKKIDKDILKLMNNAVSGKTMENMRKHRNIELVTAEKTRKYLASAPNYYTTKCISNRNKKNVNS